MAIQNGNFRDNGNIRHTRHRTKTNKTKKKIKHTTRKNENKTHITKKLKRWATRTQPRMGVILNDPCLKRDICVKFRFNWLGCSYRKCFNVFHIRSNKIIRPPHWSLDREQRNNSRLEPYRKHFWQNSVSFVQAVFCTRRAKMCAFMCTIYTLHPHRHYRHNCM